ncbi:ComF family protein [uncultured Corynebacterium sp.]|uniref:ComF family protein n=1 Tax=uncultured Corynebacterium sp. TaxID=159447 RepID=UPI0025EA52B7|nr:ComF family protein [uncultured Corynebacterium sp.]
MWGELLDLAVPRTCPGCGAPGGVCVECGRAFAAPPRRVSPRVPVAAPVWSCGDYAGARRAVVVAAKEHDVVAARDVMGAVVAAALLHLAAAGHLEHPRQCPPTLVPAPTRPSAARRRGGDPVTHACEVAAKRIRGASVARLLRTGESARDSAGLGATGRRANVAGRILPAVAETTATGPVILVDDVATTGATAAHSVLVLASMGVRASGVLVFSHA